MPFLAFENAISDAHSLAPSFLWWSPLVQPPKIWSTLVKNRADEEYLSRFEFVLSNRLFISVLYVKLADRLHNLRNPKPDKDDPSRPDVRALKKMLEETEGHYLPLAERLDVRIHELLLAEVEHWKRHLEIAKVRERTGSAAYRLTGQ